MIKIETDSAQLINKDKRFYVVLLDDEISFNGLNEEMLYSVLYPQIFSRVSFKLYSNPFECFEFVKVNHDKIRILITDYCMPGQNGMDFVHDVKHLSDEIKCFLFTGLEGCHLESEDNQVLNGFYKRKGNENFFAFLSNIIVNNWD